MTRADTPSTAVEREPELAVVPINQTKVARVREALVHGRYTLDPARTAQAMIDRDLVEPLTK